MGVPWQTRKYQGFHDDKKVKEHCLSRLCCFYEVSEMSKNRRTFCYCSAYAHRNHARANESVCRTCGKGKAKELFSGTAITSTVSLCCVVAEHLKLLMCLFTQNTFNYQFDRADTACRTNSFTRRLTRHTTPLDNRLEQRFWNHGSPRLYEWVANGFV